MSGDVERAEHYWEQWQARAEAAEAREAELRKAMEALADEWQHEYPVKGREPWYARELRAALAAEPTPAAAPHAEDGAK